MATTISGDNGIDKVANGTVDLTTDVTGSLPSANGGLPAAGTSGNVLTSNGTAWTSTAPSGGVTSLNGQTGAITNTDYGAIGSYVIACGAANTAYSVGSTIAGSSLAYISGSSFGGMNFINESGSNFDSTFRSASSLASTTLGLSGTWRTMTRGGGTPTSNVRQAHLWVRIS